VLLAADSKDVVVVAGLPGAGKTTLVAAEPRAVDSDAVREAWAPRLAPLPYRIWRPLVHAGHWVAIWRALGRSDGVVVVRPFTSTRARRSVLRRALRHHAAVHLVVVEATPAQAREGQRARGRMISARAMRRHERRWARADLAAEPWTTMTRVPSRAGRTRAHPPANTATQRRGRRWTGHRARPWAPVRLSTWRGQLQALGGSVR
jgi:predicted kinase